MRRILILGLVLPLAVLAVPPAKTVPKPQPFEKVGVAFVQKHCVECHGDDTQKKDIRLDIFRDEKSVLKARATWEAVFSKVINGEMPPSKKPRPAVEERDAFLASLEAVFDRADRAAPPDPGRVVARRLNRTEYNNTVRDLIGVDFLPAEDFPSDDIGYGFDNIGDVLTLSPTLMERYLAAAEQISQRAIVTEDTRKPPINRIESKFLAPRLPEGSQVIFRPITPHKKNPVEVGPLVASPKLLPGEDYNVRTKIYTEYNGKTRPRVALLASGKNLKTVSPDVETAKLAGDVAALRPFMILKTEEVVARNEADRQYVTVRVPLGTERLAVAVYKQPTGESPPTVYVKYIAIEGPLDTRPSFHRKLAQFATDKTPQERARLFLDWFASRAYRRSATKDEVERLAKFVDNAMARGEKWEDGIRLAIQAALVSPKFLFRLETLDPAAAGRGRTQPIDENALASRLSYFLWASMPDDELLELAKQKKLGVNLDAQVRRMLKDPKAVALVDSFALQWLQLRRLETFRLDRKLFPTFTKSLREAMLQETQLFVREIFQEDRSVMELIDADFTYLNEALAGLYGIKDTRGNPFGSNPSAAESGQPIRGEQLVRVALKDSARGGLLTQASILSATSNPTRTSPVKRGRWVLDQILGQPPPPPAPNVPPLAEDAKAINSGSLRARMERHRADPSCASCHERMDAIGFALENFDASGAWRTKDGEFPIDASGVLPDGSKFNGPGELKAMLRQKQNLFVRCLTEKMMIYALGRGLEVYDRRPVHQIIEAMARDNYKFSTLVVEIVKSEPFRLRRGKE